MKRILATLLAACLALALLAACGKTKEPEPTEPETTVAAETTAETTVFTIPAYIVAELTTPAPPPPTAPPTVKEPYVFYVYRDDRSGDNHYQDIAYMGSVSNGDDGSISISTGSADSPQSGGSCMKITYTPTNSSHWAGMMWLSGSQNFPPSPPVQGVDVARAERLTFWARGSGATKFFIENDAGDQVSQVVRLTGGWQQYTLRVPAYWNTVCLGFGWASNWDDAGGAPMTFYVDEIRFEG